MASGQRVWGIEITGDSDTLERLVHEVYLQIARRPADLADLKRALMRLLTFLASPDGRTHDNCVAVDMFFCVRDDWEVDWEHLPPHFQDVLEDLGEALHDTISAPAIAENFDSTPEQLLARVWRLEV